MMLDLIGRRHGADLAAAISEQFVVSRIRQRSDSQRLEIAARYGVHNRKLIQVIGTMQRHMETRSAPMRSRRRCRSRAASSNGCSARR